MANIINDDCLNAMKQMDDNSIDCIVTDPPYGLGFMGKKWDACLPHEDIWKEALRICKPGAFLLAFGGTRTYHRITCAIEDAGWEIKDSIIYLYGSGFPKSHNFGCKCKGSDSQNRRGETCPNCQGIIGFEGWGTALKPSYEPIIMAMKPIDGTYKKNAQKWNVAGINIEDSRLESKRWPANVILDEYYEQILILKDNTSSDIIDVIEEYFYDYKLPNLSKRNKDFSKSSEKEQSTILQQELLLQGIEQKECWKESFHVREEAHERINQSNEKQQNCEEREGKSEMEGIPYEQRLQTSNVGFSNSRTINNSPKNDNERINPRTQVDDGNENGTPPSELGSGASYQRSEKRQSNGEFGGSGQLNSQERTQGNSERIKRVEERKRGLEVLACHIPYKWIKYFEKSGYEIRSPDCAGQILDEQSGKSISRSGGFTFRKKSTEHLKGLGKTKKTGHDDFGGASRFFKNVNFDENEMSDYVEVGGKDLKSRIFYCAKASSRERNEGLQDLPLKVGGSMHPTGRGDSRTDRITKQQNIHPTVKPLKLMEYLLKLVCPKEGVILDPFCGSGSTLVAAKRLGIKAIGIEKEKEYCEIAQARIDNVKFVAEQLEMNI